MARAKDDPLLNRLFEDPAGGDKAAEGGEEARAALRRDVLAILDASGDEASGATIEPLDDGLISAYLDDALDAPERTALEARLAASSVLREQVAAASLAREAGLESGLAMPLALATEYDGVPGPAKASTGTTKERPVGLIGRLFGGPMPARRWLAASLPVLAVVVVVAALGPQIVGEREALKSPGEGAGMRASKPAADAEVKLERAEERETDRRKRAASPPPAEAAKPKPRAAPKLAKRSGRAGAADSKAKSTGGGKDLAVLTTTVVPLSSELRDAVVTLGRSQQGLNVALPSKKEMEKRSFASPRPSTGSSADKAARESRLDKPAAGMLSQRPAGRTPGYIDVINRAVAPDCTKDPASCCGSHQVDDNLLNRLLTSEPLQSVKVLHLSSRACYLTLP
jgi:hypothetical protein